MLKFDSEFHSIIVKGANNVLITNLLEGVSELVDKFISEGRRAILSDERNRGKLLDFHEKIYLAIKNRDAYSAYKHMQEHFQLIKENI